MSTFRRVSTGHRADGKSIVASDGGVEGVPVPGLAGVYLTTLWGADQPSDYPDAGIEPAHHDWFPPIGGVRFIEFVLAPDSTLPDTSMSEAEINEQSDRAFPGLLGHFDPEDPGMHRSATTDMLYVISGRCVLELDDGSATALSQGDVVVQSGTMHRWSNPHEEPCRIIGALVGATLK
ncbi:MAG: mannose-6-phosphate isomerase-like protein (cupin superfamily) [Gammaproteobacteria bacterium]|jgi:mannose-6-phosphate isomerase-like protein (cupin superfamily)